MNVEQASDLILTPSALEFVSGLQRRFNHTRQELLHERDLRQVAIDSGEMPDFLESTADIRSGDWSVAEVVPDLTDRKVEITGPVDRKMIINALNSGAKVFMADFEDASSPTWSNMIQGQANLYDAIRRQVDFTSDAGKEYELADVTATLMVRPRGWHLVERHIEVDGEPASASLVDFGLYFFHNAAELIQRGSGPYFYLPKLESHHEARLWNDVFVFAQETLGIPVGTIRATVLIETILAAFEMDEILYELRDHSAGLNAGRWDYIFSIIKKFRNYPEMVLPDRGAVSMSVPFMAAYTDLLVKTCHRRGAHAMGGMAAFIPNRRDPEVTENALAKVRADKEREASIGHDGTWVAHPDLIPLAMEIFAAAFGDAPNQLERQREDVAISASDLLDTSVPGGAVTEAGVRLNVDVGIQYIAAWLGGNGAAAIYNLMEDAATAEISRSQIWQWVHTGASTEDGVKIDRDLIVRIADQELERIRGEFGEEAFAAGHFETARELFETVALSDDFADFLTLPGYEVLTKTTETQSDDHENV
ncbi:MAG: malate synthase A [Acidimicrobiia bacterium]|nr:malate synthase A [Acidimicrobiia bacterium]